MPSRPIPRGDLNLDRFRELLAKDEERIRGQLARIRADQEPAGLEGELDHEEDEATETYMREEAETMRHVLEHELAENQAAVSRIDNGTYGICERCGVPIPMPRLEFLPASRFCIECAAVVESLP